MNENLGKSLLIKNVVKRLLTAVPLLLLTIYGLLESPLLSQLLIKLSLLGCLVEWVWITMRSSQPYLNRLVWLGGGGLYIIISGLFFLKVGAQTPQYLLPLFLVIWTADIGAYAVGSVLGGPKLAPTISPGKTWSGALGGFLLAFVGGLLAGQLLPEISQLIKPFTQPVMNNCFLALLILVSQAGDLLESYAKRYFGIKDSSQILPGHGGFLDRLDSILGVGFFFYFLSIVLLD